jgi:hypothetical protein
MRRIKKMKPLAILTSALIAAPLLLSSCAAAPHPSPADESVPIHHRAAGTGVVFGRAVAVLEDGTTHVANKETVILIPKNSVIPQGHHKARIIGITVDAPDRPRYPSDAVKVSTDGDGNFRFINVPPGEYVVTCTIDYYAGEDVSPDSNGGTQMTPKYDSQTISAAVSVQNGATTKAANWRRDQ